jgi:RNA polymerase sigma factor (sigma-70 family)
VSAALVKRAKDGDAAAREELLVHMLPLVIRLARSYKTPGLELEDFVQEGMVGVLRALARFDPELGTPFVAYASWWIRYGLQDLRSQFIRPLSLPPKALRRMAALKEAQEQVYRRERRDATLEELSMAVGLPAEEVQNLLRVDARVRGLDEPIADDPEVSTLGELLVDPLSEEAYEDVLSSIQAEELRALVTHLSEREREVLASRYGLEGREEETLREVGERLGVSPERVRQLETRALAKLRHQV